MYVVAVIIILAAHYITSTPGLVAAKGRGHAYKGIIGGEATGTRLKFVATTVSVTPTSILHAHFTTGYGKDLIFDRKWDTMQSIF
jgi:hypothetical protein